MLIARGLISRENLALGLKLQGRWGSRLGDIVLAMGWVKPLAFYKALAEHFQIEFINLMDDPVDRFLLEPERFGEYAQHLYLPWRKLGDQLVIAATDPTSPFVRSLVDNAPHPERVRLAVTSKFDILWELQRSAGAALSHHAVHHLSEARPEHSAKTVITGKQKRAGLLLAAIFLTLVLLYPYQVAVAFNALITVFLFGSFIFRTALCWMSCSDEPGMSITDEEVRAIRDEDLPVYTILVPMYKEPEVLPILAAALKNLDYPLSKLDIKLVLEADDMATIEAAKALALDASFEIIRVPPSLPKTKPKACNYALRFARGQYLTIYDAEDKPEPDQLKKVVAAFRRHSPNTACIQARLNYYNAEENWLTRMFTLEYSLWFEMFLPALDRLRVPIPLGGTSNHFDLNRLVEVGAWDPYNVTEDADLGLRFAALGYEVGVVNSVTYEEANSRTGNWIRQRSRWIKGYIQTWLVNMREPVALYRKVGPRGFWSFQMFVGGGVFSGLAYPFLLAPFLFWVVTGTPMLDPFFSGPVLLLSAFNLIVGNSCLVYLSMLAAAKRHHFALLPHAFTVPAYWCLMSVAAYKGLWQLVTRPFYWEKTAHGISKFTAYEIEQSTITAG